MSSKKLSTEETLRILEIVNTKILFVNDTLSDLFEKHKEAVIKSGGIGLRPGVTLDDIKGL